MCDLIPVNLFCVSVRASVRCGCLSVCVLACVHTFVRTDAHARAKHMRAGACAFWYVAVRN